MKINYTNLKKEFPIHCSSIGSFKKWFLLDRYWGGKLIHISIKQHLITIDLRGDLFFELTEKNRPLSNTKGN